MYANNTRYTCATCRNSGYGDPRDWHRYRHPFTPVGGAPVALNAPQTNDAPPATPSMPFDPVLRQALIDKGVLTPDDLRNAEGKIAVITGAFMGSMSRGDADDANARDHVRGSDDVD